MEPTKTEIEMLRSFMSGKMIFEVAAENKVRAGPVILSCKALVKHIYQTLNGKEVTTPLGPHTVALSKEDTHLVIAQRYKTEYLAACEHLLLNLK